MAEIRLQLADKERLRDALLRVRGIDDQHTRNFYVSELQERLQHTLVIQRYPDTRHDIWSILSACETHPSGLTTLVSAFRSVLGDSWLVRELQDLVSSAEQQMGPPVSRELVERSGSMLAAHQRDSLAQLLGAVGIDHARAVYREARSPTDDAAPQWAEVVALIRFFEAGNQPGRLLGLVDQLAHHVDTTNAILIHQWIDAVGTGLGLSQHDIRQICARNAEPTPFGLDLPLPGVSITESGEPIAENRPEPSVLSREDVMITDVASPQIVLETPRSIWSGVPPRNPVFTGRSALLDRLRSLLAQTSQVSVLPQTLHGLGGVGKTQLAVEYVYRYASEYDLVWWIPAELPSEVRAALAQLAERLRLPRGKDLAQTALTVLEELRVSPLRWLMVYDNADNPEDIGPLLPQGNGHVIITSRNHAWAVGGIGNPIEVDVFSRKESVELLTRRRNDISPHDADLLAEKLGDLPLALDQAANWQVATGMPVDKYLELFDEYVEDLLSEGKPATYPTTVYAFLKVAVERLREKSEAAAQLLELFAFLGHEPLPLTLLQGAWSADVSGELAEALKDPIALGRATRELGRYGLAKVENSGRRIQVHRLVQLVLKEDLRADRRASALKHVHALLAAANPGETLETKSWPTYAAINPHVEAADLVNSPNLQARRLVIDHARYLLARGDVQASEHLAKLAVQTWRRPVEEGGLGSDHEFTLVATLRLANARRELGHHSEALELDRETYRRLCAHPDFGVEHEHTLAAANSLALDLRLAGKYAEAKAVDDENYERHVTVYGEQADNTWNMRNNVVVNLRMLGKFQAAYDIDVEVARSWEDGPRKEDPRALLSISNVARDLYGLGRYAEALEMQAKLQPEAAERLGPSHTTVLLGARTIAIATRKLGDYELAAQLADDNCREYQRRFGATHEHTLAASMSFANCLRSIGEVPQAQSHAEKAVKGYREMFGEQHPLTLVAQVNLAIILRAMGEHRIAYELDKQTYAALREVLSDDHPYTLSAATGLANDLVLRHELVEANKLSQQTLARSHEVRRPGHPYTLACAVNAGLDLQGVGEIAEGQKVFNEAVERLSAALGATHPEVRDAKRGKRAECDIEPPPT